MEHDMKKIGFLSFGHWSAAQGSATRSASDVLLQSIELAVAAEELGADGAYYRVHHFAQQLASRSCQFNADASRPDATMSKGGSLAREGLPLSQCG
jgi:alkanesulfonate monooxygenase SsuD/methylene tetrahydromethanopterin reductase-like flavin-dependent oxidoreductase (luciferase family)